jgi:osmotically-inducible protein OsmY
MVQTLKSDGQIQQEVLQELDWDTRVEATDVGVEVDSGVVTLTGTVANYATKLAAREAAHRVSGVLDVVDDVQVHVSDEFGRTDTDLAQAVRHALTWDIFVPEAQIQTTIADGWVTLMGEVDRWADRVAAEKAVENLIGVRGVTNRISVDAPALNAPTVRAAIEQALDRRAERESNRIGVAVDHGRVVLTGRVQSRAELQAIEATVAHTRGVREVENHLQVGMVD